MSDPADVRLARARRSLEGLSVGDAFGERFFGPVRAIQARLASRDLPPPPWRYTDDTVMALSVIEVLAAHGGIDADALARAFARRWSEDPGRGYGRAVRETLEALARGEPWRDAAGRAFGGQGSLGNGAAMRAGPVGAFFADDLDALVEHADRSAAVTHAHAEGRAGAVAVALAAAWACLHPGAAPADELLTFVHARAPAGPTRDGLAAARELGLAATVEAAAARLGSGVKITAPDTVPFALWVAARRLDDYERALWDAVAGLGDTDTVCAITGSVVVLATGVDAIPSAWRRAREPLC